ncbi:hypothetical protein COU00_00850 [Candidatus Falkowbacteria bacterium CG10_big_fil_rev_8_21_14_0_10_43_11]|uniref:Uncharacterized protein n=1 Tax=Candidatus Falkowbacteria bacterium CG10_big_fil_rev_8_21_14_0_10_43_11 TaxID=1974568 RepID=A0A2M6WMU2_9BACT|nr:MAG: hypothetical protein COU00_00850 [Candidatus Falkowbacteria bacterium CG10_big_fil_rev_8_21_14_0_10_43_11]
MKQKIIIGIILIALLIVVLTYWFLGLVTAALIALVMLLDVPIYNKMGWIGNAIAGGVALATLLWLQSIFFMGIAIVICEIAMLVGFSIANSIIYVSIAAGLIGVLVMFGLWKWQNMSWLDVWYLTKQTATTVLESPNIIPELAVGRQQDFAFDFNGRLDPKVFTFPALADSAFQFSAQNNVWMLVEPKAAGLKIASFKLDEFLSNFVSVNDRGWQVPPVEVVSITTPDGKYALPEPGQTLRVNNNGAITIGLHAPKLNRRDVPGLLFASVSSNGRGGYQAAPLIISVTRVIIDATAAIVSPDKVKLKTFIGIDKKISDTSWIQTSLANTDAAIASGTTEYTKPLMDTTSALWNLAKKMAGFPTATPTPTSMPIPTVTPASQATTTPTIESATK